MILSANKLISCSPVHEEWQELLNVALQTVDNDYLKEIQTDESWLPGLNRLFSAFSLSLSRVKYILLGESPYPREESANGYAFWDDSVGSLWSESGLSKSVNRATSLRNWMKALLLARGDLQDDLSQQAIARIDKSGLVQTAEAFFQGMMKKGFLLLNASLIYSKGEVKYHAKHWRPFIHSILCQLEVISPSIQLVLFGKIADNVPKTSLKTALMAEHPFNISFITNPAVLSFFKPFDLLARYE
ncbi:hypothetical protein [Legionella israelensis]|uniref:Uracil DNA glycosylase n=1 Tax=Legionella israelensis TaxID=454 RepID=A0A0W0W3I3_9GAMM|nr:hypothetical protein [Legionella israelensis]KTD26865.1 uracil DNA glycosylase [Legionella israelensis]QBS08533.1 uracil-DNA glycosylase [Legionella israelensis]SCX76555.1 Uracil-DNA glycosylase [Legionella israelensis DSM 19235]STX58183.1 uracil-DNA glycosylase [Legionella israelensis]